MNASQINITATEDFKTFLKDYVNLNYGYYEFTSEEILVTVIMLSESEKTLMITRGSERTVLMPNQVTYLVKAIENGEHAVNAIDFVVNQRKTEIKKLESESELYGINVES